MRSSKSRSRNKANRNRSSLGNVVNRVFDSSGPEGKVRGTPQQIIEKYNQLARDAQLSNDRVATENFQQHAEHYLRMLSEAQKEVDARREQQERENRERQAQRDRDRFDRPDRDSGSDGETNSDNDTDTSGDEGGREDFQRVDPSEMPQPDLVEVPEAAPAMPRKMLPPPMTTPTCTPIRLTSAISPTMRDTTSRLMPYASSPIRASPESFNRMRW